MQVATWQEAVARGALEDGEPLVCCASHLPEGPLRGALQSVPGAWLLPSADLPSFLEHRSATHNWRRRACLNRGLMVE